jgi:hypothetical protein
MMLLRGYTFSALLALMGCATFNQEPPAAVSEDGLTLIPSKDFNILYVRPDNNLDKYDSIYIDKITVEFERGWETKQNMNDSQRITQRDIDYITQALDKEFRRIFAEELTANSRYTIADKPDHRTLIIKPSIVDLYINSPPNNRGYRTTVIAESAGRMTLQLEIAAPKTKQSLLRFSDHKRGREYGGTFNLQNTVTNKQEGDHMMRSWAKSLGKVLENPPT